MIAIVCVYNNKNIFDDFLGKSLLSQTTPYELIALDNNTWSFSSAAQALNYGALQVQSESAYIMFAHQDIDFCSPTFLEKTEKMLAALPDLGIAGVAGINAEEKTVVSNIMHGTPPVTVGRNIERCTPVMTVDECCAVIPRSVFEKHQLDASICEYWHLYMVEYCLRIKEAGLNVYVFPSPIYHASRGEMLDVPAYFRTLKKILRRHARSYKKIHTTCGRWSTGVPVLLQMNVFRIRCILYAAANKLIERASFPAWLKKIIGPRLREYGNTVH
jgi:GT2 family glycosyltransferase